MRLQAARKGAGSYEGVFVGISCPLGWCAALLAAALCATTGTAGAQQLPATAPNTASSYTLSAIDRVWSSHRVGYAMSVTSTQIFVAYYDANRQLTIASRPRDADSWTYHKVDCWTGWDSHNYIAMALDSQGQIHVVANLHRDPLVYYRTSKAGDVRTLSRIPVLVNADVEQRMTYPIFLDDGQGRLILKYRDGGSGNGNEIYDVYDPAALVWHHLLSTPLTDGEGQRNAYFVGPTLGPDKFFHLAWVWRETPAAETNHDLSYARSRDLLHWERSDGTPLTLPIRLSSTEIVDPVPVGAGMINNNTVVGFDQAGRTMITYQKFDKAGNTQIFVARREAGRWAISQASRWTDFRWDFRGQGSLESRLFVKGPEPLGTDRLRVAVIRDGSPIDLILDTRTLAPLAEQPGNVLADRLKNVIAVPAGMQLNTLEDPSGTALAWPTRPPHRDRPSEDIAEPTILRLVIPH